MRSLVVFAFVVLGCNAKVDDPSSADTLDAKVDAPSEAAVDGVPVDGGCDDAGRLGIDLCCCSGDALELPTCGPSGWTCEGSYSLHSGSECGCYGGSGPCCYPSASTDSGHPVIDSGMMETATPMVDGGACLGACCCQGDVVDFVMCTDAGPTCKAGYNVYFGDDCRCLPDRDTPCCLPHVFDAGAKG